MRAYEIGIESDEDGFYLVLRTDAGHLRVNVQDCATQLLAECEREIKPWALEAASVRRIFECGAAEIDESAGAYELSDPKHPRHHSTHVDLWDVYREGK